MTGDEQADATVVAAHPDEPTNGSGDPEHATSTASNEVVEHLLFHKALADHDPERLNAFIRLAEDDLQSFQDPFDQAIAIAFNLVLDEHLDPWSIDLIKFSRAYMDRLADAAEVDLITSGRLLAMAWQVLLAQTDELLARAQPEEPEPEPEPWDMPWEEFPDEWGQAYDEDPDVQYNQRVLEREEPPITESVFHQGDRRVTLFELVEALDEARDEAQRRRRLARERRKVKKERKDEGKRNVKKIHKEDLEAEIADVRKRVAGLSKATTIQAIFDGTREDYLTVFISCLFLHRAEMADVTQEDFPYGPIMVEPQDKIRNPDAPLVGLPKKGKVAAGVPAPDDDQEVTSDDEPTTDPDIPAAAQPG